MRLVLEELDDALLHRPREHQAHAGGKLSSRSFRYGPACPGHPRGAICGRSENSRRPTTRMAGGVGGDGIERRVLPDGTARVAEQILAFERTRRCANRGSDAGYSVASCERGAVPNPCQLQPIASPCRFERFQTVARFASGDRRRCGGSAAASPGSGGVGHVHAKIRNLAGRIARKLPVAESHSSPHFLGTSLRRKLRSASANSRHVG
jgi:hypothetical protein